MCIELRPTVVGSYAYVYLTLKIIVDNLGYVGGSRHGVASIGIQSISALSHIQYGFEVVTLTELIDIDKISTNTNVKMAPHSKPLSVQHQKTLTLNPGFRKDSRGV
ncbi:hypothetical protein TCT1_33440 [Xenorhabdus sp. TCT-1]|uniref:Uncharacterized protein n=1 Tax=Xenorhabdus taiwanensis TaxID=3085177 RepID=A0ABN7C7T1_9GAMM|nr:hypothetical protein TCT1_33440 [Xenorhabdus sp. TCT-1]